MPFPVADVVIAGISALGDFLFGSSQEEGTVMTGRPNQAFAAQDQANRQISGELARAQAQRGQPVGLPEVDVSGLSGQVNVPGLDISLGMNPAALGVGNQDFFAAGNAQRAAFNEANPVGGGGRVAVPRGGARVPTGQGGRARGPDEIEQIGEARNKEGFTQNQSDRTQQGFQDPEGTLDMIGEAVAALLARTDQSARLG